MSAESVTLDDLTDPQQKALAVVATGVHHEVFGRTMWRPAIAGARTDHTAGTVNRRALAALVAHDLAEQGDLTTVTISPPTLAYGYRLTGAGWGVVADNVKALSLEIGDDIEAIAEPTRETINAKRETQVPRYSRADLQPGDRLQTSKTAGMISDVVVRVNVETVTAYPVHGDRFDEPDLRPVWLQCADLKPARVQYSEIRTAWRVINGDWTEVT